MEEVVVVVVDRLETSAPAHTVAAVPNHYQSRLLGHSLVAGVLGAEAALVGGHLDVEAGQVVVLLLA